MAFGDDFRSAVERALAGRAASRVAKDAGLPSQAIATILEGRDPLLPRAAEVAEALGLELCVRRKGEALNPHALRLALMSIFVNVPGEDPNRGDYLARRLVDAYPRMLAVFDVTPPEQWDVVIQALESGFREYSEQMNEYGFSPETRERFATARRAGEAVLRGGDKSPSEPGGDGPHESDAE